VFEQILEEIEQEIGRLEKARDILAGAQSSPRRSGTATPSAPQTRAPRRRLGAQARRAIAEAQHGRWAKVKAQKKEAPAPAPAKQEAATA
jgi:hypothetical protein